MLLQVAAKHPEAIRDVARSTVGIDEKEQDSEAGGPLSGGRSELQDLTCE